MELFKTFISPNRYFFSTLTNFIAIGSASELLSPPSATTVPSVVAWSLPAGSPTPLMSDWPKRLLATLSSNVTIIQCVQNGTQLRTCSRTFVIAFKCFLVHETFTEDFWSRLLRSPFQAEYYKRRYISRPLVVPKSTSYLRFDCCIHISRRDIPRMYICHPLLYQQQLL